MSIPANREYPITVQTHFSETCETFCALLVGPPTTSLQPLGDQFCLGVFKRLSIGDGENFAISPNRMKIMFREISQKFGSETVRYDVYWQNCRIIPGSGVKLIFNNKPVIFPEIFNVIIFGFTSDDSYSTQIELYTDLFPSRP